MRVDIITKKKFIRIKNIKKGNKAYPYAYLCRAKYIKRTGKPKQKIVKYLGRVKWIGVLDLSLIVFNECKYCGCKENLTIDHIIPLCSGGKNNNENIQVLCKKCNCKKGKLTPILLSYQTIITNPISA